jgi:hypothetical protein
MKIPRSWQHVTCLSDDVKSANQTPCQRAITKQQRSKVNFLSQYEIYNVSNIRDIDMLIMNIVIARLLPISIPAVARGCSYPPQCRLVPDSETL